MAASLGHFLLVGRPDHQGPRYTHVLRLLRPSSANETLGSVKCKSTVDSRPACCLCMQISTITLPPQRSRFQSAIQNFQSPRDGERCVDSFSKSRNTIQSDYEITIFLTHKMSSNGSRSTRRLNCFCEMNHPMVLVQPHAKACGVSGTSCGQVLVSKSNCSTAFVWQHPKN